MSLPFECAFRDAGEDDIGFVVHSWLESMHDGCTWLRKARFGRYKGPMRRIIHRTLARSVVLVACDPADPRHLVGFVVAERVGELATCHYVYVRQTRRKVGLARELGRQALERLSCERWAEYTCDTIVGMALAQRVGAEFAPFSLWEAA